MGNPSFILLIIFIGVLLLDNLQIKINEFCKKLDKYDDQTLHLYFSQNLNVFINDYLFERNYLDLHKKLEKRISEQILFEKKIKKCLEFLEQINIEIIGLKGYFLQKNYYQNNIRLYKDLDILVKVKDCYRIYLYLKEFNYKIKKDDFLLYNNTILFTLFKNFYATNVHSIDLVKDIPLSEGLSQWERDFILCPIDLSCNLNIDSPCLFEHKHFFTESLSFDNYKNIYQPNEYDNILYLIYHMMRHLVFYKYDSHLMSINLQKIVDVALIIDKLGFDFDFNILINQAKIYQILPEVLFYFNIYNKMGFSTQPFNIENFFEDESLKTCKWKFILEKAFLMDAEDIILGNYENLKYLSNAIEKNQKIKNQNLRRHNIKKSINKDLCKNTVKARSSKQ